MANTLTQNPIIVTTAMTSGLKAGGNWSSIQPIRLLEVYWLDPLVIGDTFTITDDCGNTLSAGRCEVANQSQFGLVLKEYNRDIQVTQISSGTLYLSVK